MAYNNFRDLLVWEKAHLLVLKIYRYTKTFPKEENYCLTNQLRRSVISIAANIAEGCKKTKKDFVRYLFISQASLEETKYYFILSLDLGYLDKDTFNDLENTANETGKMINGLINSLNANICK